MIAAQPTRDGRIWSFSASYESFIVVLFTDQKISLFDPNGAVLPENLVTDPTFIDGPLNWIERTTGAASTVLFAESNTRLIPVDGGETVQNGDFDDGDLFWTVTEAVQASVTFGNSTVTLTGGNNAVRFASIEQLVSVVNTGIQHDVSGVFVSGDCKLRIGTTSGAGDILDIANYTGGPLSFVPSGDVYLTLESYGSGSSVTIDAISIVDTTQGSAGVAQEVTTTGGGSPHVVRVGTTGGTPYRIRVGTAEGDGTYLDVVTSSDTGQYLFTPAGNYWITVDAEESEVVLSAIYSYIDAADAELTFNTPYPNNVLNDLYFVTVPDPTPETSSAGDTNTLYVLHPNYPPYKLTREADTGLYNFIEVSFDDPPQNWTGTNWPGCGTYFQGRLWLAATPNRGQRFWASKSNQPENFDLGTGEFADDALEFTLNELGRIEWMASTKNLIIGTTYGEHLVGSDGGIIKSEDIQVEQQSSYGSKSIQPIQIGDEILFVTPDGKKLLATQYDFTKDNWIARNLTFFSEHITESGIRSLAWAQHPDQQLWCALEDGTAAVLNYERGENVSGWSKQETSGFYRDFAAAQLRGRSYVLALTQRENDSLYLEIQDEDIYLDSYVDVTSAVPTTTFPGFDHLAGLRVQVILDGALHPDVVVSQDGIITTDWEGTWCEAGLGYTSTLQTLPLDQRVQTGSMQPYYKRYDQLLVTMLDSALPIINGERRPDRTPSTPMDTREPNSDGLLRTEQVTLGWSQDMTVTVEQPLPLACTVLSISGRLAAEKL